MQPLGLREQRNHVRQVLLYPSPTEGERGEVIRRKEAMEALSFPKFETKRKMAHLGETCCRGS